MAKIVKIEERLKRNKRFVPLEESISKTVKGVNGVNGRDGVDGLAGRDGLNGINGRDGLNGRDGVDGRGLSWKGNWLPTVEYEPNDVVNYLGSTFIAIAPSKGKQPRANSPEWSLMAAAGSPGNQGIQGEKGEDGVGKLSFETVSKNLDAADAVIAYDAEDNPTSITYSDGVVKTFTYTGEDLTTITLSGATPEGIDLIKTLSYTGENLTEVTYS